MGKAVQDLYALGGRDFLVLSMGNVVGHSGNPAADAWKQTFNDELAQIKTNLQASHPDLHIYLVDMNGFGIPTDAAHTIDGKHYNTASQQLLANYVVAAVPEPASLILLLLGIGSFIGVKRKIKL